MYWVRMGEQHGINLMDISEDEIKTDEISKFHNAHGTLI